MQCCKCHIRTLLLEPPMTDQQDAKSSPKTVPELVAEIARRLVGSDGKGQLAPDTIKLLLEQQRVLLDAEKVQLEKRKAANDQYKNFLDQWRTDIAPLDKSASLSRQFAVQFAQTALRTVFLLNGGAFVAVPAFAKLVDVSIKEQLPLFIVSMAAFAFGLVLSAVVAIFAFKSTEHDAAATFSHLEVVKTRLNKGQNPNSFGEEQANKLAAAVSEEDASRKSRDRMQKWALAFGIAGLVCFVIGASVATIVMARA